MTGRPGAASRPSVLWLAAALAMVTIVAMRLTLSFDLSAFFPAQSTLSHDILIEQIQRGPASRLFVVGIGGGTAAEREAASEALKDELAGSPLFAAVMNGAFDADDAEIPDIVERYYPLMRDLDFRSEPLSDAVQSRLRDLAFGGGSALGQIIALDPFLATLDILEALAPAESDGDFWVAADGRTVVMAETWASSIDTEAQRRAMDAITQAFAGLPNAAELALDVTGVGAFSIEMEQAIRAEAMLLSIAASLALMLVLLFVFRRLRYVLLSALPLGMAFLAGVALVSLVFDNVHGITLAFGFTLLGVAIDYPLHLFSHARESSGPAAIRQIWPTMRLGVVSTAIAYLALVFAGSSGLAQLGTFTAAGVLVAALVTRTWLPVLLTDSATQDAADAAGATIPRLGFAVGIAALTIAAGVIVTTSNDGLWDDNLSGLSPVPAERLQSDRVLRAAAATADMRYQLVLHDASLETLLADCEQVDSMLATAVDDGLLGGWQAACQLLPSVERQLDRQGRIPVEAELRQRVQVAIENTPFRADAFEPFVETVVAVADLDALTPADFSTSSLRSWLDAHLVELDSQWVALVSLVSPDADALAGRIAAWPVDATLVDLKTSSVDLMHDYRNGALRVIGIAAILILIVFWFVRQRLAQMIWVALTVSASVACTVAVTSLIHGSLTVIHLVALLLVFGLGLDYALFLSRTESPSEKRWTDKGVLACAASTTLAFGVLASSSIPVLAYLGLTVASGSVASYGLAYVGSRTGAGRSQAANPDYS